MKKSLIALSLISAFGMQAYAQNTVNPMTSQTPSVNTYPGAGTPTPRGERTMTQKQEQRMNHVDDKSRAEVKEELKTAKQAGELPKAGEIGVSPKVRMEQTRVDEKSRAEVKADTNAAKQAGKLPGAGEKTPPARDVNPKTEGSVVR